MLENNTAEFTANVEENVVEITQLKTKVITKVGVNNLLTVLKTDLSQVDKVSLYCSKAKMKITLGSNFHLRTSSHSVNTYLTKVFKQQLLSYVETMFPEMEKVDKILSTSEQKVQIPKKEEELSKEEKIKKLPIIKMAEYSEPSYDDANCNGYPNHHFIGIEGRHDETIEISFEANEDLFDPQNGVAKDYLVGNGFNLYDNDGKNIAYANNICLICTHSKPKRIFEVRLLSTQNIEYCGFKLKEFEPLIIASGRLPEPIKYKSNISQLVDDYYIPSNQSKFEHDVEELPWEV